MRLIPARAGNTYARPRFSAMSAAHPRSRGEHRLVHFEKITLRGSSPLARGTLIPSTFQRSPFGSSPLARGTREHATPTNQANRLIPARAGNTRASPAALVRHWAHPRSRGEHLRIWLKVPSRTGSSPLARGTPNPWLPAQKTFRLIPARAGNTRTNLAPATQNSAHPRSRGEHSLMMSS